MDLQDLSEPAAPAKADPKAAAKPQPEPNAYEPLIHGESAYDRVTSMLMSVVVSAALIVGWLWLVYYTNQAYAAKVPAPVVIIEVTGGGSPDGEIGAQQAIDTGGPVGEMAANAEPEDASAFEEPAVQETNSPALSAFDSPSDGESEGSEVADSNVSGAAIGGGGERTSQTGRLGGKPLGYGGGPGSGGVRRSDRWLFDFDAGQGEEEYGRMLDTLHIELATPAGGKALAYASNFTTTPTNRTALHRLDKRLYLSWSSVARRQYDLGLLRKAGVQVGDGAIILQFLPKEVTDHLGQIEYAYKKKQPGEIRRTRFKVITSGNSFDFQVTSQEYLR